MGKQLLKKLALGLFVMAVLGGATGCSSALQYRPLQGDKYRDMHLKYNFHCYTRGRDPYKVASIVNYVRAGRTFLPYNTVVSVGRYRTGFKLRVEKTKELILVDAPRKYLGINTLQEYLDLILSKDPVTYTGLSKVDMKGISSGQPGKGMSKKAIMVALGYPAPSFTPNLDADVWHYWNSRFVKCNVHFKNGLVDNITRR